MVGVEGDGLLVLLDDLDRHGSAGGTLEIDPHADFQFIAAGQRAQGRVDERVRVDRAVGFFGHEVDVDHVADVHVDDRFVKTGDHHADAADEL